MKCCECFTTQNVTLRKRTLTKHGEAIAEQVFPCCEKCDEDDAAWTWLIVKGMRNESLVYEPTEERDA